jgi:hypothetical protein
MPVVMRVLYAVGLRLSAEPASPTLIPRGFVASEKLIATNPLPWRWGLVVVPVRGTRRKKHMLGCKWEVTEVGAKAGGLRQLDFKTIPEGRRISVPWRSIRWALSGEAEPWAVVEFRMDMGSNEGITWLRYDVEHFSMRTGSEHYPVSMLTTPCQFGGSRWWWLCPATGRRVGKLYLPNGGTRFLSRGPGAYRLAYASQRHGRVDRMHALWELTATDPPGTACRRSRKVCTGEPTTRYATGWKLRNTA